MILDNKTNIPLLVAEIMSQPDKGDCSRMVIYSAFYVRLICLLWINKQRKDRSQSLGAKFKFSISTWYFEPDKVTQRDVGLEVTYMGADEDLLPLGEAIKCGTRVFHLCIQRDRINLVTRFLQSIQDIAQQETNLGWLYRLEELRGLNGVEEDLSSLLTRKSTPLPRTSIQRMNYSLPIVSTASVLKRRTFLEAALVLTCTLC